MSGPFIPSVAVPCGDCYLCCKGRTLVPIIEGDDASIYETQTIGGVIALAMKPNGDCFYLGESGCTIHGRAPAICRFYDCRGDYARRTRAERRRAIADGLVSAEVLARGRELSRASLPPDTEKEKP